MSLHYALLFSNMYGDLPIELQLDYTGYDSIYNLAVSGGQSFFRCISVDNNSSSNIEFLFYLVDKISLHSRLVKT